MRISDWSSDVCSSDLRQPSDRRKKRCECCGREDVIGEYPSNDPRRCFSLPSSVLAGQAMRVVNLSPLPGGRDETLKGRSVSPVFTMNWARPLAAHRLTATA